MTEACLQEWLVSGYLCVTDQLDPPGLKSVIFMSKEQMQIVL